MPVYQIQQPFIFTLFGASGDLAKLKLFPDIYQLAVQKRMPKDYYIVGFARTEKSREQFQQEFAEAVKKKEGKYLNEPVLADLLDHIYYFTGQYTEDKSFLAYREFLKGLTKGKAMMHLTYFSIPPHLYRDIAHHLANTRASKDEDIRLIIEKPFGDNEKNAEALYHDLMRYFTEDQIYLLDHYLGKSSVQSIMHLRYINRTLSLLLRGQEISNIQITAFEDIGIGERVGYFENVGIIKDMIQSHLLQTLALTTMSMPATEGAEGIHRERYNILSAIKAPTIKDDIVLGQYASYRNEKGVAEKSATETFVALRLSIDRESWSHVPIYLRTGKKVHEKHTFVVVELKKFEFQKPEETPNRVIIELQPNARIDIQLLNRLGEGKEYKDVTTSDSIACDIEGCLPDHAALILDAIKGDKTYFLSFPEVLADWRVTDAILDTIKKEKIHLEMYPDGSRGPASQDRLTAKDEFTWYDVHV